MDESIKKKIISWNNNFPIDRWWRQKHGVAFNSKIHREISFLDQLFEFYEDKVIEEYSEDLKYKPNEGNWLKSQERSVEERQKSIEDEAAKEFEDLPDEIF